MTRIAAGFEIAKQIIRCVGTAGAPYRATMSVKPAKDFIYIIEIVLEEADKFHYWLQIIRDADLIKRKETEKLIKEANEFISIRH